MREISAREATYATYPGKTQILVIEGDGANCYLTEMTAMFRGKVLAPRYVAFFCDSEKEAKEKIKWFTDGDLSHVEGSFKDVMIEMHGSWDKAEKFQSWMKVYGRIFETYDGMNNEKFLKEFKHKFVGKIVDK